MRHTLWMIGVFVAALAGAPGAAAQDEIDIDLVFTDGPLAGETGFMRLYVTSLPAIGGARVYDPMEHGTLNDMHAVIGGVTYDDSDDADFPDFPHFRIQRTAVVSGNGGGGRSFDLIVYGPGGERFELLAWGAVVGLDPLPGDGICRFSPEGNTGLDTASNCMVASITMSDLIDDEKAFPPSPPDDDRDGRKDLTAPDVDRGDPPPRRSLGFLWTPETRRSTLTPGPSHLAP